MSSHDTSESDRHAAQEKAARDKKEAARVARNQRARDLRKWTKAAKRG